jgi:uncharacterized repeat protein (TIGR04076 family)
MMAEADPAPWDLELAVIDVLGQPGCGWNYSPGFKTLWDGRHFPEGMCPFAWNAFSPVIWTLRYAEGNRPLGNQNDDEVVLVCPDPRHQILWRVRRTNVARQGRRADLSADKPVSKLRIEVDELPRGEGCHRGYRVGDHWDYDGRFPEGFCPLAWNALSLWVWPLRYGANPRPMEWEGDSVRYSCPNAGNTVVFHVSRTEDSEVPRGGGA